MRRKNFDSLNKYILLHVFNFLGEKNLSSWFSVAASESALLRLAYNIVAMQATNPRNRQFLGRLESAYHQEIKQSEQAHVNEMKMLSTANYFLCLGIDAMHIACSAAENGQIETLRMLHKRGVDFWTLGYEVPLIAARHNQGRVIEFLHSIGIDLIRGSKYDPAKTVARTAISCGSLDVIRALGTTGFDFSQSSGTYEAWGAIWACESFMHLALNFELCDSKEKLLRRYKIFLAMLEAGSFPREGTRGFLKWMNNHFESIKPVSAFHLHPPYLEGNSLLGFYQIGEHYRNLENEYPSFFEIIEAALNKYVESYKKASQLVKKANVTRNDTDLTESKIECTSLCRLC